MSHESIVQFKEFTGVTDDTIATQMLECCEGDVSRAVELYFARQAVVEDGHDVQVMDDVQVIKQDDDDVMIEESSKVQNTPIVDEDGVRAPMQRVQGRLVEGSFRDQYGTRRRRAAHPIFEQNHEEAGSSGMYSYNGEEDIAGPANKRQKSLMEIFRPPIDIISRHKWDPLLMLAQKKSMWILVNLQDSTEFASQVLNRDVWSNVTLKELIKVNFLFWQMYRDSAEGHRIASYYSVTEFPAVFIVDPRTGEMVQSISSIDPDAMLHVLSDFTEKYPTFQARDSFIKEELVQNKMNYVDSKLRTPGVPGSSKSRADGPTPKLSSMSQDMASIQAKRMKRIVVIDSDDDEDSESPKPLTPPSSNSSNYAISFQPWRSYVPSDVDPSNKVSIVLRMPDNSRESLDIPLESPIETLFAFISEKDLDASQYNFVLTFPRRVFKIENAKETLQQLGFHKQELIHVERV
ncbi:unnamed protein product [Bursaphelenchus xylophilus]|uniref:(pine wood nematode) hypothetical protein n=1 Tax=Bursaphelenchus xylophilus TaxID=6326 RepID=A0A1I7SMG3_BURXY|nr:unnamed protein product [Bursaphelenchus xylophilus]CAG9130184.1 unnamed protein product [Bursaphelenchus xylophilus]